LKTGHWHYRFVFRSIESDENIGKGEKTEGIRKTVFNLENYKENSEEIKREGGGKEKRKLLDSKASAQIQIKG